MKRINGADGVQEPGLVSIIIPVYNQFKYTAACLQSIRRYTDWPHEIIVVDNGSTDGTAEQLRRLPDVRPIINDSNRGFAAACNQGIRAAQGRYCLLLNNDTLVGPRWLENLVRCAASDPQIGLVGPRSNHVAGRQLYTRDCKDLCDLDDIVAFMADFNSPDPGQWVDLNRLVGFCLLIKDEVIRDIGYLDEQFGLGNFEDDDYCLRAREAGYRLVCAGDTFVWHFGERTFEGNNVNLDALMKENAEKFVAKWQTAAADDEDAVESAPPVAEAPPPQGYFDHVRPEIAALVPATARRVLDVGCAGGRLGELLKRRGATEVVGVEVNREAAETAKGRLDRVFQADVQDLELPYEDGYFDCIIYGDVLEHLTDPWRVLSRHARLLGPEGRIVCSLPNVAHISVIAGVLNGRWEYQAAGILDRSHLRFFTRQTSLDLLQSAGYRALSVAAVTGCTPEEEVLLDRLQSAGLLSSDGAADARTIQYLVVARPRAAAAAETPRETMAAPLPADALGTADADTAPRPRLSLCMIVKDEDKRLPRCLESVAGVVDEIIVVDTGSSDATRGIAAQAGARVFDFEWRDDFAAARNYSLEQATGDWVLFLDADEELIAEDRGRLRQLLTRPDVEGYRLTLVSFVGEEAGADTVVNNALRLFRRRPEYRFKGAIHEQILWSLQERGGKIESGRVRVNHYGYLLGVTEEKGKVERNLEILRAELEQSPDDSFNRFNLGTEYVRLERYEEALAEYQRAFMTLPNLSIGFASMLLRNIVLCLKNLSRYDEALKVLEDALEAYPDYTDLVYLQGWVYAGKGDWKQAIESFQRCLSMGENCGQHITQVGLGSFRAWHSLGQVHEALGDLDQAVKAYVQALRVSRGFYEPLGTLGRVLRGREKPEHIRRLLTDLVDCSSITARRSLAGALIVAGDYEGALEQVETLCRDLRPKSPAWLSLMKADALLNLGHRPEALTVLETVDGTPAEAAEADHLRGLCLMLEGNRAEARRVFLGLASDQSTYVHGLVYLRLLDLVDGRSSRLPAFKAEKDALAGLELTWNLLQKLLQWKEFELFETALALLDKVPEGERRQRLGKLYCQEGYTDSGAEELLAAVQLDAVDADVLFILGRICRDKDYLQDAEVLLRHAIEREPDRAGYYTCLSDVFVRQKKYQDAAGVLEQGRRRLPYSQALQATSAGVRIAMNLG